MGAPEILHQPNWRAETKLFNPKHLFSALQLSWSQIFGNPILGSKNLWKWGIPKKFYSKLIAGQNPNYLWKNIYFLLFNWLKWVHPKFCINLIEEQKQNYSTQNIYFPPFNLVDLNFLSMLFFGIKKFMKMRYPKTFTANQLKSENQIIHVKIFNFHPVIGWNGCTRNFASI